MIILIITEELDESVHNARSHHRVFSNGEWTMDKYLIAGVSAYEMHQRLEQRAIAVSKWKPGHGPDPLDTPLI